MHPGDKIAGRGGVIERALLEGLGHRLQRRDRTPQLVRDIRDEIRPDRLETPKRGEVLDHDEELTALERTRDDAHEAPRLSALDRRDVLAPVARGRDRVE